VKKTLCGKLVAVESGCWLLGWSPNNKVKGEKVVLKVLEVVLVLGRRRIEQEERRVVSFRTKFV
jgi:hypothetical protein